MKMNKFVTGLQLCFGQPVDVQILTLLRSEIDEVREAVQTWMLKKNQVLIYFVNPNNYYTSVYFSTYTRFCFQED
jgi:hypothetical protein